MNPSEQHENLHKPEAVAIYLGVSYPTVSRLIRSGALESIKVGGGRRVTSAALDKFLASTASGE